MMLLAILREEVLQVDVKELTKDTELAKMLEVSGSEVILSGEATKLVNDRDFTPLDNKDFSTLFDLVKATVKGEYDKVPWVTLCVCVGAVAYVAWARDAINDKWPKIGRLDDIGVVTLASAVARSDLDDFLEWERNKASSSSLDTALGNLSKIGDENNDS